MAFAPFNYWFLLFFSLPASFYILAYLCEKTFWPAWWFGFAYFGAGISWVHVSIAEFGGLPLLASIGLMVILCAYLALFPALLFKYLQRYFRAELWPLALPFAWLLMEWLRARILSGFPWLSVAYSQSSSPLSSYFPLIGEIGLSALIVLVCISLAVGVAQKRLIQGIVPLLVLFVSAIVLNGINWTTPTGETKKVALVQGNIPQSMRWDPEEDEKTMAKYKALTAPLWDHDIIIWPEAAVPALESLVQNYIKTLNQQAIDHSMGLITGVVNYDIETDIAYNSMIALGVSEANVPIHYRLNHENRYSKHHLLPIGEFVPLEDLLRPLAPIFDLPMSSFSRGDYVQDNLLANGLYFVPAICFEIAFPRQVAANITTQSNAIVTVSNDAWFGDSHGPHQHLQIAQVRAIEFGLPVLRATNNGVTAIIDHNGQILQQLPQFTDAVLSQEISLVSGATPYLRFGDWPIWCISLIMFGTAIYYKNKRTKESE